MQSVQENDARQHRRTTERSRPDMGSVSRMLALRIDHVVQILFPAAKLVGREWLIGSTAGEPGTSLAVHSGGVKSGIWADFSTGQRGDALELVALTLFGGNRLDALAWALAFLGLDDGSPPPRRADPVYVRQVQQEPERTAFENWRRILIESTAVAGTLAEAYLASRGLRLPDNDLLRFHRFCPCRGGRHPALIAVMTDPMTNEPTGIHRTFLAPDGRGKAQINTPKMMLGRTGVIRLTPDEDVTQGLGICEGVETGLAIIQRAMWKPIWSATTAGGIASFPVLAGIQCLTIFADHDPVNNLGKQPGVDAARKCAERWHAAGREVIIQQPPLGMDWDDALRVAA